ncbi:MarR family winged helix-turn-helix transcriptional regulator [Micrococcus sp.]|uniref:MarR family winged helix-turn-helix transcriptional regulator n=1 Tax=Micrococcus sp. TaxID=1271 RepID=UPI0026DB2572|nr:MarR family transcriptional regulator [Micrococcus sp.]MDO4240197.1 winged helix DNA-binding protein [Micrococcus sp.]
MTDAAALADQLRTGAQALAPQLAAAARREQHRHSPLEAAVLARLDSGSAATSAEIARLEGVTAQAVSTAVAALSAAGLVTAAPDPDDHRRRRLALTAEGRGAAGPIRDAKNAWLAERLAALTPAERAALTDALSALRRVAAAADHA